MSRSTRRTGLAHRQGDFVLVEAGETIPCDGEVVGGITTVDESAITGRRASPGRAVVIAALSPEVPVSSPIGSSSAPRPTPEMPSSTA